MLEKISGSGFGESCPASLHSLPSMCLTLCFRNIGLLLKFFRPLHSNLISTNHHILHSRLVRDLSPSSVGIQQGQKFS